MERLGRSTRRMDPFDSDLKVCNFLELEIGHGFDGWRSAAGDARCPFQLERSS
jgi:hypothetical protein